MWCGKKVSTRSIFCGVCYNKGIKPCGICGKLKDNTDTMNDCCPVTFCSMCQTELIIGHDKCRDCQVKLSAWY
jgi:hypothetical protein